MSTRLTPRQAQGHARLTDMLETVRLVKGDAFHAVAYSAVQARTAMAMYDVVNRKAASSDRIVKAQQLMDCVRQLATSLGLPPGQLREALKHARVMHREAFER